MTRFLTTSSFRDKLSELLKVRKGVYSGIEYEIYKAFQDISIETIRNNRDMILLEADSIVVKLRLPDKKQKISRKDGYRLIYLASKQEEIVVFLTVYPKNGPLQQLSVSKDSLKELLSLFISEAGEGKLESYLPLSMSD